MEHDAPRYDGDLPASASPADIREYHRAFVERGLDVIDSRVASDVIYESNDSGHLAWDLAPAIRAACIDWGVRHSSGSLEKAVRWSKSLCERTDEAREIPDFRGDALPRWSAGRRYSASTVDVPLSNGGSVRIQAIADRLEIARPSETTAVFSVMRDGGADWTSKEVELAGSGSESLTGTLSRASGAFAVMVRSAYRRDEMFRLQAGVYDLKEQRAAHVVHTGAIARALLAVAEILDSDPWLEERYGMTAEFLCSRASVALRSHDHETSGTDQARWYAVPLDFPGRRLGVDLPHNHVVDVAASFLVLGSRFGHAGDLDRGDALVQKFLGELSRYQAGALEHPWYYYPHGGDSFEGVVREDVPEEPVVPAARRGEDSSHATMRIRALVDWKSVSPGVIPDDAMVAAARSLRHYLIDGPESVPTLSLLPDGRSDSRRLGQADTYPGAWALLSTWDDSILRRVNSVAFASPPRSIFGATLLSAAELVAANSI